MSFGVLHQDVHILIKGTETFPQLILSFIGKQCKSLMLLLLLFFLTNSISNLCDTSSFKSRSTL